MDAYLLELTRLLQKQANGESTAVSPLPLIFSYKSEKSLCGAGPLQHLAREHAGYLFGQLTEQPRFECKAALTPAVIGAMEAMATAVEDANTKLKQRCSRPSLTAEEMQHALVTALGAWNGKGGKQDSNVKLKQGKFMPHLRMAATGRSSGADLFPLLALLGAPCVASRLRLGAATLRQAQRQNTS